MDKQKEQIIVDGMSLAEFLTRDWLEEYFKDKERVVVIKNKTKHNHKLLFI
jgi:hypothetical protein